MNDKQELPKIGQGQLPCTWSDILGSFEVGEIRKFPIEGQALTNARHAIPRMNRRGQKFRTRAKENHFFILCTTRARDGAKLTRQEIEHLFRCIDAGEYSILENS